MTDSDNTQEEATVSPNDNPAQQSNPAPNGGKMKKTLTILGLLLLGGLLTVGAIKLTPLGEALGKTESKSDNAPAAAVTSNTPDGKTKDGNTPDGKTKDDHDLKPREHVTEVVVNSQEHELLKDVPRVQPDQVLRKEHFMVNGELVTNLDRLYMYMPDDSHLPTTDDPVARLHYKLNYGAINGVGLDPNLLNGKHFDVVHYVKSEDLTKTLESGETVFFGGIAVTFKDDGRAIMNLSSGLADDAPESIPTTTVRHTREVPSP